MKPFTQLLLVFFLGVQATSYGFDYHFKPNKNTTPVAKGAGCQPANYRKNIGFNDVGAQIETGGLLFLDRANGLATYKVPKTSQVTAIFAASLWMGGLDVNGQLKIAAVKFRSDGNDFWTGPLNVYENTGNYNPNIPMNDSTKRNFGDATIDAATCLAYDNIFTITKAGVIAYSVYWECTNVTQTEDCIPPTNETLAQIYAWPGNGGPTQDLFLAPFYDRNQNGVYEPGLGITEGDYPWYDDILGHNDVECGADRRVTLFGDETHWWVFNDKGNVHSETGGDPIGMEVRAQAFSFATNDEINQMTFYNYELINRGTQTLSNTYFSQYIDPDLGNYADDYVGCDVSRGLGIAYNGDLNDEDQAGRLGYGANPPAIGVDFFEGPYQDADGIDNPLVDASTANPTLTALNQGGIVYKGLGIGYGDTIIDNERFGMRNFTCYTGNGNVNQSDPTTAFQFYNYMKGLWRFGTQMSYGGTGFNPSTNPSNMTNYMFPGDSDPLHWATLGNDPGFDWTEYEPSGPASTSNPPGDRRFVQSAGPFTLKPGAVNNITVGIIFGRSNEGDLMASYNVVRTADTKAQALFDACFRIVDPPAAPTLKIQELGNELILMLDNPMTSNNFNEQYAQEDDINIIDPVDSSIVYDKYFRFEGYQIFQLVNEEASLTDLDDKTKARLVAQCDIKNGVSKLVNFEFDQQLGFSTAKLMVEGENKGIRHSFRITEDAFATGNRTLVNHKQYYYMAVAYAYNNYKTYNPNDPQALDGQKKPYFRSRLDGAGQPLESVLAMPHFPAPEQFGTVQQSVYGQGPRITRLDGAGNGSNALQLTNQSEEFIIENGFLESLEYEANKGPISVKVIDPLNVASGYFECVFSDDAPIDSASWVVNRYSEKGGELLESIHSDQSIATNNEQLIPEWGIAVTIEQKKAYFPTSSSLAVNKTVNPIGAEITFADTSKRWLQFVSDNASFTPYNWIRSGNYASNPGTDCPNGQDPFDFGSPCCYNDEIGKDPNLLYSKLLGGGVAPHKLTGYQCGYMPLAVPNWYNAYIGARTNASISYLPNTLVVLTDDQSKWTRCVVIEMGRDQNLNQNNGEPGELRKHPSVDKNGNPDASGTEGMGWFPGYAIDLETGMRLHMAFGENSFLGNENGSDMIWNPTSTAVDENGIPVMGGVQPIWVYGVNINNEGCPYYDGVNNWVYDQYQIATSSSMKKVMSSLMWIFNPLTVKSEDLLSCETRITLSVEKPYRSFDATGINGGLPMYTWNMDELKTITSNANAASSALELINVVPNPYYAFSEYERNRLDTRVRITNLPEQCTVSIYNVSGKMIRQFKKDSPLTYIDWDLKNSIGVPIASGVYLIHVEAPGIGEKIVKFFGGMRQVDLENI